MSLNAASEDDYDRIPDAFEGINWDEIPELSGIRNQSHRNANAQTLGQDEQKSREPPNRMIGPGIVPVGQSGPHHNLRNAGEQVRMPSPPPRPSSSCSSSHYWLDEPDSDFMEELNALEASMGERVATSEVTDRTTDRPTPTLPSRPVNSRTSNSAGPSFTGIATLQSAGISAAQIRREPDSTRRKRVAVDDEPSTTSRKRLRHSESTCRGSQLPKKKAKKGEGQEKEKAREEVDPHAGVRRLLAEFEDDLTCPICCDLFAVAHTGNPCGHTFCASCGWSWISNNKRSPTCATCRTKLGTNIPMIPNIAINNMVERYVSALAASGSVDWQPTGAKYTEWSQRKQKWKTEAAQRAAAAKKPMPPRAPQIVQQPQVAFTQQLANLAEYFDALDEDYEDSDDEDYEDEE